MKAIILFASALLALACGGPDTSSLNPPGYRFNEGTPDLLIPSTPPENDPGENDVQVFDAHALGWFNELYGGTLANVSPPLDTRCGMRYTVAHDESRMPCYVPRKTFCIEFEIAPSVTQFWREALYDAMQYVFEVSNHNFCFVERPWGRANEDYSAHTNDRLYFHGPVYPFDFFGPGENVIGVGVCKVSTLGGRKAYYAGTTQYAGPLRVIAGTTIAFNELALPGYSNEAKRGSVLHELGHCLGLGHNDADTAMQAYVYQDFGRFYFTEFEQDHLRLYRVPDPGQIHYSFYARFYGED